MFHKYNINIITLRLISSALQWMTGFSKSIEWLDELIHLAENASEYQKEKSHLYIQHNDFNN